MGAPAETRIDTDHVQRLLSVMFDRGLRCKPAKSMSVAAARTAYWGVYKDRDNVPLAACMCDLAMAATLGAALLLFPTSRVAENISARQLEPVIEENFREVLNILAQVFNTTAMYHVRFSELVQQRAGVPKVAAELLASNPDRWDLEVAITGYAGGRMTLLWPPDRIPSPAAV